MLSYHPTAREPNQAAYGFRTADRIGQVIRSNIWSGIVWRDGRRAKTHFMFSDWCVLDFDDGQMTLAEAVNTFCDCIHVIGTTKSHQKEKGGITCDRFRLAIPWECRIGDLWVYEYNMQKLTERYPIDPQCKDGARYFFPCASIVSASADGYKQDVLTAPPKPANVPVDEAYVGSGVIPRHVQQWLCEPAAPGTVRTTLYKIGAELAKWGFSYEDAFQLARQSATATTPGVMQAARPLDEIAECVRDGWKKGRLDRSTNRV